MPVIKPHESGHSNSEAVVLDLGDLQRQAERLKSLAREGARRVMKEAEVEAASLRQAAEAEGREAGMAQGLEEGRAQGIEEGVQQAFTQASDGLGQIQTAWTEALGGLENWRLELEREAADAVLDLALRLAGRVVHQVVELDREVAVNQVAEALRYVLEPIALTITVHPEDLPALEEALPDLIRGTVDLTRVHLKEDVRVGRGGVQVEHGVGRIDATIEKQFARLVEVIRPGRPLTTIQDSPVIEAAAAIEAPAVSSATQESGDVIETEVADETPLPETDASSGTDFADQE